ncbi:MULTISPECIES: hypothetical protein [Vibrio]|uniref:hypothetical protein n=1 Tax=Vibrio TaxID=662 RepID=UPI000C171760|nr:MULTISPECIES: hypothetical protein [Vibrio]NAW69443.1 hypothetical protein [Vibrio sp. V28_P6S34P95]NAX05784.1 hypothetical protein [Vibrio sp. V30_P3S12P165]NAX35000.1 hypothetical protein [Vibrio sp. V29_P1S30P107]NAX38412.1 hypothetical protein [Vibrio sp. V27_P1S3P104]NNN43339.1 hypothetical protein [Vibrio sp. 1-1(7)]
MNPVSTGTTAHYTPNSVGSPSPQISPDTTAKEPSPSQTEATKVTLSEEGKALLAALKALDEESQTEQLKSKTVGDKVEAFTHGALGMDHPKQPKQPTDTPYTAGKYLSAAAKVGGMLLLLA